MLQGIFKQRPCRCLRSITDDSLVLIELVIQLSVGVPRYYSPLLERRRAPGLVATGHASPARTLGLHSTAQYEQYSTRARVRSLAHACGVLCCHSSHPRFTTSLAWSATSNSMQLASSLGSGGWVSTSRERVGTSCARPSWLDSQARATDDPLEGERGLHSGNVYMCPLSAFLSLSLSTCMPASA